MFLAFQMSVAETKGKDLAAGWKRCALRSNEFSHMSVQREGSCARAADGEKEAEQRTLTGHVLCFVHRAWRTAKP